MEEARFLYVTAVSRKEAERIATALLEERLVACANIFDGVTSLYRWEGEVKREAESVLIAKTVAEQTNAAIDRIKELHSYACPCVVVLPVTEGNHDFLSWIRSETQ